MANWVEQKQQRFGWVIGQNQETTVTLRDERDIEKQPPTQRVRITRDDTGVDLYAAAPGIIAGVLAPALLALLSGQPGAHLAANTWCVARLGEFMQG